MQTRWWCFAHNSSADLSAHIHANLGTTYLVPGKSFHRPPKPRPWARFHERASSDAKPLYQYNFKYRYDTSAEQLHTEHSPHVFFLLLLLSWIALDDQCNCSRLSFSDYQPSQIIRSPLHHKRGDPPTKQPEASINTECNARENSTITQP